MRVDVLTSALAAKRVDRRNFFKPATNDRSASDEAGLLGFAEGHACENALAKTKKFAN